VNGVSLMERRHPVTIGIAGFFKDPYRGEGVILCGDRMLTFYYPYMEFEGEEQKIITRSKGSLHWAIIATGEAGPLPEVLNEVEREESGTVRKLIDKLKIAYGNYRLMRAQEDILLPRGIGVGSLYSREPQLPPELVLGLDRELANYELKLELLVAGIDESGPHIYTIRNPGISVCADAIGFDAVGSGMEHGLASLIGDGYHRNLPLNKALYTIYKAKRASEVAPGVGRRETDIIVITKEKLTRLSEEDMEKLKDIYENHRSRLQEVFTALEENIGGLTISYL